MATAAPNRAQAAPAAPTATPSAQESGVTTYKQFQSAAPLYGSEKKQAAYSVWESTLQPGGMSLDRFTQILTAADADGNDSLKQDELGYALFAVMENGEMSWEQASAVWDSQGWAHNFDYWSARH